MKNVFVATLFLATIFITFNSKAEWRVDCDNYCFFNDIQPNCQGVYWQYPGKGGRGYSSWNSQQNGCLEINQFTFNTHLIEPSQINCNCPTQTTTPPSDKSMDLTTTTRTKLELLRAQVQGWTMCSPDPAMNYPDLIQPFLFKDVGNCQQWRKRSLPRNFISQRGCFTGMQPVSDLEWHACNYLGDQSAETASSCLAGQNDLCNNLFDAQDPVTGGWYRNPYMRRHPVVAWSEPSFSRDGMLGMLAYWIKSKNKNSIFKWLNFVKNNGTAPWAALNLYNLCPPRPNIPKPSFLTQAEWDGQLPDDRCAIIPEAWGLIYSAITYAGVTPAQIQAVDAGIYNAMVGGYMTLDTTLLGEASSAPALGGAAYQISDTFDAINIRMNSGGTASNLQLAARTINERTGKLNPMYHYLGEGKSTEYGGYLIRKYCTAARPILGVQYRSGFQGWPNNWTDRWFEGHTYLFGNYQYAGSVAQYGVANVPNGHDCLTMINLALGNSNLTELQCDNGDVLVNGACLRSAFIPPTLAMINGIDYKINIWTGKLDYTAVDQSECPYGGTFKSNPLPARCELPSGLLPNQFNSNVNYWVDPNQDWPGIYYAKINNGCPYGGASSGPNCQLKGYARPILLQGVKYWADPNPSWPGVYYLKVNNGCPYGGTSSGANCQLVAFSPGVLNSSVPYFTRSNPAHPGVYYYPHVIAEKKIFNPSDITQANVESVRYLGNVITPGVVPKVSVTPSIQSTVPSGVR